MKHYICNITDREIDFSHIENAVVIPREDLPLYQDKMHIIVVCDCDNKIPYNDLYFADEYYNAGNKIYKDQEDKLLSDISKKVKLWDEMEDLIYRIDDGDLQVKYSSWFFSGGHGEDADMFEICDGDTVVAKTDISTDNNEFSIRIGDSYFSNYGVYTRTNTGIYDRFTEVLAKGFVRDDTSLAGKMYGEGNIPKEVLFKDIPFPRDFYDVTRDDVLSGEWPHEMDMD